MGMTLEKLHYIIIKVNRLLCKFSSRSFVSGDLEDWTEGAWLLHAAERPFAFVMVASDISCVRQTSAVRVPLSCSFDIPVICSSVNREL